MKSAKSSTFKCNTLSASLVSAALLAMSLVGNASASSTATGTATATVVTPIAIANSNPNLRFGSFSTASAGDTVVIATNGARTLTGAVGVGTGQNAFGAASFAVTGDSNLTYAITLPATAQTITTGIGLPTQTMAVTSFVSNPSGTGTLSSGAQTLLVGATLTTVALQAAGVYTGSFSVTVAYN